MGPRAVSALLDTCTVAEIRKPRPDEAVVRAVRAIPDEQLFLGTEKGSGTKRGQEPWGRNLLLTHFRL